MNALSLREHLAALDAALPMAFRNDALVSENLENLRRDLQRWTP